MYAERAGELCSERESVMECETCAKYKRECPGISVLNKSTVVSLKCYEPERNAMTAIDNAGFGDNDTIHYCKDCAEADMSFAEALWKCFASEYPNYVGGGALHKTCKEARKFYAAIGNKAKCRHFKALEKGEDDASIISGV